MSDLLGCTIPALERHAVSVSFPTWKDVVDYEKGDERVFQSMKSGYPRFFWHEDVKTLCKIVEARFGSRKFSEIERCILFPVQSSIKECLEFLKTRSPPVLETYSTNIDVGKDIQLYAVFVPENQFPRIKEFWQHTGEGISSRMAARCVKLLTAKPKSQNVPTSPTSPSPSSRSFKNRYHNSAVSTSTPSPVTTSQDLIDEDADFYVEERYGRNLAPNLGSEAKLTVRKRIAGVLGDQSEETKLRNNVTEDEVYLYPAGMNAIFRAHVTIREARKSHDQPAAKSVVFGFVYGDTLKLMEKFGPGCHFLPRGDAEDLERLAKLCETEPIAALYCEFPSNPLLKSPDLKRLKQLATQFGFILVVDDTVGNFWNIDILPLSDVVVSSLTKIFSGDCNVMAGSMILNPSSQHYNLLKKVHSSLYEDACFSEDSIYLERNSRDFIKRIKKINFNTETLCDFFENVRLGGKSVIKLVSYPKFATPENYRQCLREGTRENPGYGGLFSLTFSSVNAAATFYDAMPFSKGPSLGTNFTLACPYTVLVHFTELEWAREYGVEEALVRVSIGMEDTNTLLEGFKKALEAAENV